ncbi:CotJB protein [Mycobacteroides abscessus subsp. abscessus]|nr:CotJB protein [Mycobacteroides abscessus subsp. abscessus]
MIIMIILIRKESMAMAKQMGSDYYQLMHEIQAADFVLVELTLYLDTHPGDRQALQQFQQFSDYSRKLKKRYLQADQGRHP